MRFAAWYGIVTGFFMIGQWLFSLLTGGVPELQTAPWEIGFHRAAETVTALALILGAVLALGSARGGRRLLLCALGMVIYSEIASGGYFAERGQWRSVGMFAALLAGALLAAALLWKGRGKRASKNAG